MSQLRQPGDYLKNSRTGASPPRVHTFTVEPNQKQKINFFFKKKKGQLPPSSEREQMKTVVSKTERENRLKQLSPSCKREQFETATKRVHN